MNRTTLSASVLTLAALVVTAGVATPAAAQQTSEPVVVGGADDARLAYQEDLSEWWRAAGRMWLDEAAYRVTQPVEFKDGLCKATMTEGMVIPVWAGKPPLSERIVGFVYVGDGALEVEIPQRADRWRMANHAARHDLFPVAQQAAIADGSMPLKVGIERGLVLSADPMVRELLAGLEPVGGGTMIRSSEDESDGIDEAYVITEKRGKLRVKTIATNLLPQRRLQLQRAGLDPRVWLRQDRLLHDELGVEGAALRMLSEWRTDQPLRVAAELGAGVGNNEYDRWLGCFRDPMDQEDLGYDAMAFAHGTSPQGDRHFERFAGRDLLPVDQRPGAWLEADTADVTVATRPKGLGNERFADVDAIVELRAVGGPARAVTLSMPVNGAVRGTWKLHELSLEDGTPLARVGLTEDLLGRGDAVASFDAVEGEIDTSDGASDATTIEDQPDELTSSAGTTSNAPSTVGLGGGGGGGDSIGSSTNEPSMDTNVEAVESLLSGIEGAQGIGAAAETALVRDTPIEHFIQVVLPTAVPEGETVRLRVHWKARWPFANWSNQGRSLGTTTGAQELLPRPVPSPGGARWDSKIRVGWPAAGLSTVNTAISGDTVREWDEDTWTWLEAEGRDVVDPKVALGRWESQIDTAGSNMPAVRVNLFVRDAWALPQFPPEVRRVVAFLHRFLPDYPVGELDVFQGASGFTSTVLNGDTPGGNAGLIEVQTIKTDSVTDQGAIDDVDPYLTQSMIAAQVARQVWGLSISPATSRDQWLVDGLAEAYGAFYIRAAFGNDAYADRMALLRTLVEDPTEYSANAGEVNRYRRFLSLSGATSVSDVSSSVRHRYGAYLLADTLRLRLGDQAYFAGIDRLAESRLGHQVSTDDLRVALEEASGDDLRDVFDFWIHGGFVPDLTLQVRESTNPEGEKTLHGCIVSSVPWGNFDVPVEVLDRGGERSVSALVDVIDGRGGFDLPYREGEIEARLDPLGMIVAYSRAVKTVNQTDCDTP